MITRQELSVPKIAFFARSALFVLLIPYYRRKSGDGCQENKHKRNNRLYEKKRRKTNSPKNLDDDELSISRLSHFPFIQNWRDVAIWRTWKTPSN